MSHRRAMLLPPWTVQEDQRLMNIRIIYKHDSEILVGVYFALHQLDVLRHTGVEHSLAV